MKKISIIAFFCIIGNFCIAQDKYDSIAFYPNGKISYLKTSKGSYYSTYSWFINGHIKSQVHNRDYGYHKTEYDENGTVKYDSTPGNLSYFCESFFKTGLLQRRTLKYYPYSKQLYENPSYSSYEFDTTGQVALIIEKDDKNKVVVNESYPFKKFENLKRATVFYDNKQLKQFGYYKTNDLGDTLKYGAWFKYYHNGQLAEAGLYNKNIPWGLHLYYDSFGNLNQRKYFFQGEEVSMEKVQNKSNDSFIEDQFKNIDGIYYLPHSYKNEKLAYYFYKGAMVCEVPIPSNNFDTNPVTRINFPLFEYYSKLANHEFYYHTNNDFYMVSQVLYGQVVYKYQYDVKLKTNTYTYANNKPKYNSPIVNLELKERIEILRNDTTSHLYVTLPNGNKIEIFDRYLAINGYWEFVSDNGNRLFEGNYYNGQQGKWIEYYRNTGTPRVIQNFDKEEHKSLAKGEYKEFYSTGGKKTTGKYNSRRKQIGIWRNYFENGNKEKRARYFNGREYGIVVIANDNWVKRNGKLKKNRYLYWNGKRLFHKRTRGYEKHF
jgi:hypothetical protein